MMEFLIGNVFSTPVGQRIQRATSGALQAEDWSLNLEICDIINETEDGCKDAAKALKKRIVGNRNFREVMLALTVLEACVKNCGQRFHACVCSREFVEDVLVTAILPKNNPPSILQDRILSLIQAWADAFRNNPPLSGVVRVYEDLKRRGMEFPMTDLDSLSPIHTPSRSVPENGTSPSPVSSSAHTPSAPAATHTPQSSPGAVSPEQMQKMKSELDVVRGNLSVMSEMLNHVTPGETSASDTELLQQLYSVCKQMQQRIVELVPCVSDEEMIRELLIINDDLNNSFIRYERFDRLNVRSHTEQQVTQKNLQPAGNLIDLRPVPLPANQNTQSQPRPPPCVPAEEEFDMFAQTRSSSLADQRKSVRYEEPGAVEGLAEALDTRLQVTAGSQHSSALEDVEKWLNLDKPDCNDEAGVTSEEFDRFLSERARAAEQHQSVGEGPVRARRGSGEHQHLFSL